MDPAGKAPILEASSPVKAPTGEPQTEDLINTPKPKGFEALKENMTSMANSYTKAITKAAKGGKEILGIPGLLLTGLVAGVTLGVAMAPGILGAVLYRGGEEAHGAMLKKADAAGFQKKTEETPKGRESPVLDFLKDEACRVATGIKNYFKYEINIFKHNISVGDQQKSYMNSITIIEHAGIGEENPYISKSDIKSYKEIRERTKNENGSINFYNLTETDAIRCRDIALKVANRIDVFYKIDKLIKDTNLNEKAVDLPISDKKILEEMWNKMTTDPKRPLSDDEIKNATEILGNARKPENGEVYFPSVKIRLSEYAENLRKNMEEI